MVRVGRSSRGRGLATARWAVSGRGRRRGSAAAMGLCTGETEGRQTACVLATGGWGIIIAWPAVVLGGVRGAGKLRGALWCWDGDPERRRTGGTARAMSAETGQPGAIRCTETPAWSEVECMVTLGVVWLWCCGRRKCSARQLHVVDDGGRR